MDCWGTAHTPGTQRDQYLLRLIRAEETLLRVRGDICGVNNCGVNMFTDSLLFGSLQPQFPTVPIYTAAPSQETWSLVCTAAAGLGTNVLHANFWTGSWPGY